MVKEEIIRLSQREANGTMAAAFIAAAKKEKK